MEMEMLDDEVKSDSTPRRQRRLPGFILTGLCGLLLTGCGESFIVTEPMVTEANAVEVPDLEGRYNIFDDKGRPQANGAFVFGRAREGSSLPYYTIEAEVPDENLPELTDEDREIMELLSTQRILFARLGDSLFLAQTVMPSDSVADTRKRVKDPRLKADAYYYLYIIERVESEDGQISFYLNRIDDPREHDKLAERSPDADIVSPYIGLGQYHFVVGSRSAVLKTVLGAAEAKSRHLFWFREAETR